MNECRYTISKKLLLVCFCIIGCIHSYHSAAQDPDDSVSSYNDTTVVTDLDDSYQNKAEKYSPGAIFRTVPDSTVERMKREKEFAYANDPAYWVKEKRVYKKGFWDYVFDFFESDLVRIIFYVLLGALILFVLYRIIVVNELLIFYSSKKQKQVIEELTVSELDPARIDQQLQEAISQKNYNLAVRYLYLKTLYALNEKKWIQLHPQATNSEYLNQMSQHKKNQEFSFLTRVYEYAWYGKVNISEEQFATVHHNFKNFHTGI